MKSTLFNMVAVLLGITLIASAGVGVVNLITEEPIAAAKLAATDAALQQVLPPFDDKTVEELEVGQLPVIVYTATNGGEVVGYAVQTMTKQGFSGVIRMMVGFSPAGEVLNVNVLEQAETPGLGTKMTEEGNPLLVSIQGKAPESMQLVDGKIAVRKDGGDVDALTAATISSRAYVDAINRAWAAFKQVATVASPVVSDDAKNEPVAQEGGQDE